MLAGDSGLRGPFCSVSKWAGGFSSYQMGYEDVNEFAVKCIQRLEQNHADVGCY